MGPGHPHLHPHALPCALPSLPQVLANQRMLRQAAGSGAAATNPVLATAIGKLSLANISGVWTGIGDQFDSGALPG